MTNDNSRLGLTDDEVIWLRCNNGTNRTATALVNLYHMVVDSPNDPGARGLFAAALKDWRNAIENGDPVP